MKKYIYFIFVEIFLVKVIKVEKELNLKLL